MNNKYIMAVLLSGLALLAGLYIMISVISGGGNEIGKLAVYFSAGCFLCGLFFNKPAMYLLIFLAGYSDLIKRFMVLGSSLSQLDLMYVLAMAPLTLAGVAMSLFFSKTIGGGGGVKKDDLIRFLICSAVLVFVGVSAVFSGKGIGSLRVVADYGAFIFLIYVLPILFPERDDLLKYAKAAIYIFIPVAVYGVWQRVFGLSSFELDYLATGLSTESRQFNDLIFRPFSTLNAASSLTVVMAACTMISWILIRSKMINKFVGFLCIVLFIVASYATLSRTGWACIALAPATIFCVRYRLATVFAYLIAVGGVISLVVFSDWALDNLQDWQSDITGVEDFGRSTQALRITTLSDRLIGFSNVKDPDNWTPFGVKKSKYYGESSRDNSTYSHDMLTGFLFQRGYILFFACVVGLLIFLTKMHRKILSQPMDRRKLTSVAVGSCIALLISVLVGGNIFQFPANIFFWLIVCISMSYMRTEELETAS